MIVMAAAGNLKKVMLELGGRTPVLIYDDADLPRAIAGAALGVFINSGQGCVCGSRVYVQRGVYDQVVEGVAKAAKALRLGGPDEANVDIGPLISQKQLNRVMGFIDEGRRDGVEIVAGGNRSTGAAILSSRPCSPMSVPTCGCSARRFSGLWYGHAVR